ncbi:MAG TPA: phosphotransferase [Nitrospiria bacterium]
MIQAVESRVMEQWAKWFPEEASPRSLQTLLVGPIQDAPEKEILFFIFKDGGRRPHVVVKAARSPEAESLVSHEYHFLDRVRAGFPEEWRFSVPRPLGLEPIEGHLVFLQTCLPGRHMEEDVPVSAAARDRSVMERQLSSLADWWIVFRRATAPLSGANRVFDWDAQIAAVLNEFAGCFDLDPQEHRFLEAYRTRAASLGEAGAPVAGQHGDFCNVNIIAGNGRIGVIDWAFGQESRPPWPDLYTFASTFHCIQGRGGRVSVEEALRRSFIDDNWFSRSLGRWLGRCAASASLSPEAMVFAAPLVFMENALIGPRKYRRVREADRAWRSRFNVLALEWDRFTTMHARLVRT